MSTNPSTDVTTGDPTADLGSALSRVIDGYLTSYSNPQEAERQQQIRQLWAAEGQLVDPPMAASGRAEIDGLAAALQSQFPGHTFRRTTEIDSHHGFARYGWELVGADGAVAVAGMDVAEVDDEGRLVRVVGFFGPLSEAA